MSDNILFTIGWITTVAMIFMASVKGCRIVTDAELVETEQRRAHELQMAKAGYKQGVVLGSERIVWLPDTTKVRR